VLCRPRHHTQGFAYAAETANKPSIPSAFQAIKPHHNRRINMTYLHLVPNAINHIMASYNATSIVSTYAAIARDTLPLPWLNIAKNHLARTVKP
jgi:hypothetical protein